MTRRALVIASTYQGLAGVDNDAAVMRALLQSRGFEVARCDGAQATRKGILDAYNALIARTQRDDAVVVYYTGHGGLVINSKYVPSSGFPPYLQHICPIDFDATTENDFRGISSIELSLQLAELTKRTENATVIFECCYSAQISRGDEPDEQLPTLTRVGLLSYLDGLRARAETLSLSGNPLAVRVAAAGQIELARRIALPRERLAQQGIDFVPQGEWMGAMTLALVELLVETADTAVAWRSLASALRARLSVQRPEVEGPTARVPFSLATVDTTSIAVRLKDDMAILDAGSILGISVGDVYEIRGPKSAAPVARVTIDEASGLQSRSRTIAWMTSAHELPDGAVAVPHSLVFARSPIAIHTSRELAAAVERAIGGSPYLRPATPGERPLAELWIDAESLEVRDLVGQLSRRAPDGLGDAIGDLENLARAQRLRDLHDDGEIGADDVSVTLGVARNGQFEPLADHGDLLGLSDRLAIRLENRVEDYRWAHVFNIGLRGRVVRLDAATSGILLEPKKPVLVGDNAAGDLEGMRLSWPAGMASDRPRTDTIMVILTTGPTDLSALATPAHRGVDKGTSDLIAQLRTGATRSRGGPSAFAVRWRDYRLYPIEASLHLRAPRVDASPAGSEAAPDPRAITLRVDWLEASCARVDLLVCGTTVRTVTAIPPTREIVIEDRGPVAVYVWTSSATAARPLEELMPRIQPAPDGDPLAAGARARIAAAAAGALESLPDATFAFRGEFDAREVGTYRFDAGSVSFAVAVTVAGS